MAEHKHASVLRAIANGVSIDEFEVKAEPWPDADWENMSDHGTYTAWISSPGKWEIRRKPQHIIVNGFKVPKPLDVMPKATVYWPHTTVNEMYDSASPSHNEAINALTRNCAHLTKEAAISHCKAMLGIDPKWEE